MMKANELRIGNLFQEQKTKEIIKVIELSQEKIVFSGSFSGEWQAEPIPLTEEWLLNFGFEFKNNSKQYGWFLKVSQNRVLAWCHSKEINLEFDEEQYDYNNTLFDFECQYVHQLQNLFFSLCGEEL